MYVQSTISKKDTTRTEREGEGGGGGERRGEGIQALSPSIGHCFLLNLGLRSLMLDVLRRFCLLKHIFAPCTRHPHNVINLGNELRKAFWSKNRNEKPKKHNNGIMEKTA